MIKNLFDESLPADLDPFDLDDADFAADTSTIASSAVPFGICEPIQFENAWCHSSDMEQCNPFLDHMSRYIATMLNQPERDTVILLMQPKVAQKSYKSEKRFLY